MNPTDMLKQAISQRTAELIASIPADRDAAILALIRAIDEQPLIPPGIAKPDALTGIPVTGLGNSRALQIVLQASSMQGSAEADPDGWATALLEACCDLSRAELVLSHVETGFMRLGTDERDLVEARIAQRATPVRWQERADDAWWANWLMAQNPLRESPPLDRANALVDRLVRRFDLPFEGSIAGVDLNLVKRVLMELQMVAEHDGQRVFAPATFSDQLAIATGASEDQFVTVREALTLDSSNAAWHAAVPGIADPPLVRLPEGDLVVSRRGVTRDPFRFLTRELRRRDPDAYHSAASYRERSFRQDLYSLFSHRRFVTSPGAIELRRGKGTIRTDIDAAIFDRKSGTLAIFELKTNEPFARSTAELARTQENVRAAGRQMANVLDWINRHSADEILNRIDRQTAKSFRVQKVQAFVLGRHLIDGTEKRATWATWPQLLRSLDGVAVEDLGSNPIVALVGRLNRMTPSISPQEVREVTTIRLGRVEVAIHPLPQRNE